MKKVLIIAGVLSLFIRPGVFAQSLSAKGNIEKLCGCFEVEFKYAETFSPDTAYKYHNREEISAGLELAIPIEISERKISIQHLLIVSDDYIVKHWREDWIFEPAYIWKYKGDKTWVKESVDPQTVKGKWLQSVWEVSDAPRYQGLSEWITTDDKIFWQNTTDAPLPRREYTTRNDYNILRRTNRILLTKEGWTHEQDNQKIIRKNGSDKLLVEEKGYNTYKRTKEQDCEAARKWWQKNQEYWSRIRNLWDEYIQLHTVITVQDKIDGKALHEQLFKIGRDYAENKITAEKTEALIRLNLDKYLGRDQGKMADASQ